MIYGDHDLQRGDHDGDTARDTPPRWGGVDDPPPPQGLAQTPAQGGATVSVLGHVEQLQRDLRELGFAIVSEPDGGFGRMSEWAVREFQIYASMERVARLDRARLHELTGNQTAGEAAHEIAALGTAPDIDPPESYYVATLRQATNTARYTGPISGVVNARTRQAMKHWLANNYRCPVVVEAWSRNHGRRTTTFANGVNLWRHDQLANDAPRMFYRDFSGYYACPEGREAIDEYQVLGTYLNYFDSGGPASEVPRHTWGEETEMLPQAIIGPETTIATLQTDIAGATASTYRVVRAVSEMECMGAFDAVNAYDHALVSIGPCHWTLGVYPSGGYDDGELAGFLAYVLSKSEEGYLTAYGNFGLYPSDAWAGSNQGPLWMSGQRKYAGWVRMHTDAVEPAQAPDNVTQLAVFDRDPTEADYFRNWHWFFRWVMAGRTIEAVRHAMWDMVRLRLRDVLNIPVSVNAGAVTVSDKLGAILTSEKTVAILLRWHIYRPGDVTGSIVSNTIADGIRANPGLDWNLPLSQWEDGHEGALLAQLFPVAQRVNNKQQDLVRWPNYPGRGGMGYVLGDELGSLSEKRGSFVMDHLGV